MITSSVMRLSGCAVNLPPPLKFGLSKNCPKLFSVKKFEHESPHFKEI